VGWCGGFGVFGRFLGFVLGEVVLGELGGWVGFWFSFGEWELLAVFWRGCFWVAVEVVCWFRGGVCGWGFGLGRWLVFDGRW